MYAFALYGDIIHAPVKDALSLRPGSYAVCVDGRCEGIFDRLPERFSGIEVLSFRGKLITPGFCDLHLHAPQFRNRGLGMDLELLDWLNIHTFPEEARYADLEYADRAYGEFARELTRSSTTRAVVYATIHSPATVLLMDKLEETGLSTYVGKVCMDRNCPDFYSEGGAEKSLRATEDWLCKTSGRYSNTRPILTPRFVPTCSEALLEGLGGIMRERKLPLQSHLDENPSEVEWVRELHPWAESYADVYDRFGLLDRAVMAHCIYMTQQETELLKARGTFIAHSPISNTNIKSGIAPAKKYLSMGLNIGLATDISGGHSLDMSDVCREALGASKLLWRLTESDDAPLTSDEAFYMATRGGGAFFGDAGAFCEGFEFDAVVFDDGTFNADLPTRFERFMYLGGGKDAVAKFVSGRRIF